MVPHNKSELLPDRKQVLAYAEACETWLENTASDDADLTNRWWQIPVGLRWHLASVADCNSIVIEKRRRARLAYIRKTYGS